ncbi:hypothetical protein [Nocardia gipuzkoensis]
MTGSFPRDRGALPAAADYAGQAVVVHEPVDGADPDPMTLTAQMRGCSIG